MILRHAKLLARKYEKPEKIGSLFVPDAWKVDNSRSLWEVHLSNPEVDAKVGIELEEGWILITAANSGVFLEHDAEGKEVFILAASSIQRVIPWTLDVAPKLMEGKVLVAFDTKEERAGSLLVLREGARPTQGVVVETGDGLEEDVKVGDQVFFTRHSGMKTEINGVDHLILDEVSILGIIPAGMEAHEHA